MSYRKMGDLNQKKVSEGEVTHSGDRYVNKSCLLNIQRGRTEVHVTYRFKSITNRGFRNSLNKKTRGKRDDRELENTLHIWSEVFE